MIPFFGFSTFLILLILGVVFYFYAKFKSQLENLETSKENLKTAFEERFLSTENIVPSLSGIIESEKLKNFQETRLGTMGYDIFSNEWLKMQAIFSQNIDEIFSASSENINFIDQKTSQLEKKTNLESAISAYQNERKQFFDMIQSFPNNIWSGNIDKNLYPEI